MKTSISRIRTIWIVVGTLVGILALVMIGSIAFDPTLHIFRYIGDAIFIVIGILFIYTGYIDMQKTHQEGQKVIWYQQPLIRSGMVFLFLALFSVCAFDLRYLLFR